MNIRGHEARGKRKPPRGTGSWAGARGGGDSWRRKGGMCTWCCQVGSESLAPELPNDLLLGQPEPQGYLHPLDGLFL